MDYRKHHDALIARARSRNLTGYSERHHIVPTCMGGRNERDNIVRLTPEEHYLVHQLLAKMYPGKRGLTFALLAMTMNVQGKRPNNKQFGWIRRRVAEAIRQRKLGVPCRPDVIEKLRVLATGRKLTAEHSAKIGAANRGVPKSAEHIAKLSVALKGRLSPMQGRTHSDETKQKMREAGQGRRHSAETISKLTLFSAAQTQEQRSARAHKAWRTKRAKQENA